MSDMWKTMNSCPKGYPVLLDIGLGEPVIGVYSYQYDRWIYPERMIDAEGHSIFTTSRERDPRFWQHLTRQRIIKC